MAKVVVRGGSECAERAERMNDWARGAMDIAADEATAHQVLEAKVCNRWTASLLCCTFVLFIGTVAAMPLKVDCVN